MVKMGSAVQQYLLPIPVVTNSITTIFFHFHIFHKEKDRKSLHHSHSHSSFKWETQYHHLTIYLNFALGLPPEHQWGAAERENGLWCCAKHAIIVSSSARRSKHGQKRLSREVDVVLANMQKVLMHFAITCMQFEGCNCILSLRFWTVIGMALQFRYALHSSTGITEFFLPFLTIRTWCWRALIKTSKQTKNFFTGEKESETWVELNICLCVHEKQLFILIVILISYFFYVTALYD